MDNPVQLQLQKNRNTIVNIGLPIVLVLLVGIALLFAEDYRIIGAVCIVIGGFGTLGSAMLLASNAEAAREGVIKNGDYDEQAS